MHGMVKRRRRRAQTPQINMYCVVCVRCARTRDKNSSTTIKSNGQFCFCYHFYVIVFATRTEESCSSIAQTNEMRTSETRILIVAAAALPMMRLLIWFLLAFLHTSFHPFHHCHLARIISLHRHHYFYEFISYTFLFLSPPDLRLSLVSFLFSE